MPSSLAERVRPDAENVMHGPYRAMPEELVDQYLEHRERFRIDLEMSTEEYTANLQSDWQYRQHREAVDEAKAEGRLTADQACYMLSKTLLPWHVHVSAPDYLDPRNK